MKLRVFPADYPARIEGNGMNVSFHQRTRIIIVTVTIIIAIVLLAGSFSGFQLKEGSPFPSGAGTVSAPTPVTGQQPGNAMDLTFLQGIIGFLVLIAMVFLVFNVFVKSNIRQLLIISSVIALLLIVLLLIPSYQPAEITAAFNQAESVPVAPLTNFITSPLGPPPQGLVWIAGFLVLAIGFGLAVWWRKTNRLQPDEDALLAGELEKTLQALDSGENYNNAIVACYTAMLRALRNEAGIERDAAMTAFEFEQALISRGLPQDAVRKLTRLFESARYSRHQPDEIQQKSGRLFLNEILRYLKSVQRKPL